MSQEKCFKIWVETCFEADGYGEGGNSLYPLGTTSELNWHLDEQKKSIQVVLNFYMHMGPSQETEDMKKWLD